MKRKLLMNASSHIGEPSVAIRDYRSGDSGRRCVQVIQRTEKNTIYVLELDHEQAVALATKILMDAMTIRDHWLPKVAKL